MNRKGGGGGERKRSVGVRLLEGRNECSEWVNSEADSTKTLLANNTCVT